MASVTPDNLSKTERDELVVSYAALMLHDDKLEITVGPLLQPSSSTSTDIDNHFLF